MRTDRLCSGAGAGWVFRVGWGGWGVALGWGVARPGCVAAGRSAPATPRYNATTWGPWSGEFPRATGNFTGSTDDIIQWAACKWGFDENTLRAQVAKESYWTQTNLGDWTTNPNNCPPGHPIGADGRAGQCPESVGLMQVRTPYFRDSIEGSLKSSAYNLDIALSVWRRCYEGRRDVAQRPSNGAANTVPVTPGDASAGGSPAAGTPHPRTDYIAAVQDYLNRQIWTDPSFINWRP